MDDAPASSGLPLHLLRLVSQGLPIGGFSYSRGLEAAVHAGWVTNEAAARNWTAAIRPWAKYWRWGSGSTSGWRR